MRFVLFQPDIAPNVGTILRLSACLDIPVDIIEPCGFPWDSKALRRATMDYANPEIIFRHKSWEHYKNYFPQTGSVENIGQTINNGITKAQNPSQGRLILLTTKSTQPYFDFSFDSTDRIMVGRESGGVPEIIHNSADVRLNIPINPEYRSVNVAIALAIVAGEALKQTQLYPR